MSRMRRLGRLAGVLALLLLTAACDQVTTTTPTSTAAQPTLAPLATTTVPSASTAQTRDVVQNLDELLSVVKEWNGGDLQWAVAYEDPDLTVGELAAMTARMATRREQLLTAFSDNVADLSLAGAEEALAPMLGHYAVRLELFTAKADLVGSPSADPLEAAVVEYQEASSPSATLDLLEDVLADASIAASMEAEEIEPGPFAAQFNLALASWETVDTAATAHYCDTKRVDIADEAVRLGLISETTDALTGWDEWSTTADFESACHEAIDSRFTATEWAETALRLYDDVAHNENLQRLNREDEILRNDFEAIVTAMLSDAERVWCWQNLGGVASAAVILGIGQSALAPNDWAVAFPNDFVRSCQAAFLAR